MVSPVFPGVPFERGMYESFYLRAVSPDEPVGAWIRYTVHKRPGHRAQGSVWCTVFDASRGAPFMHKHSTDELSAPPDAWIAIGPASFTSPGSRAGPNPSTSPGSHAGPNPSTSPDSRIGPGLAEGRCGAARWALHFSARDRELRHLRPAWLYRTPVPRTKLSSPVPAGAFDGTLELPHRTIELSGWSGMVGHNWGSEHAERWIWLHGIDFEQDCLAWIDLALARVRVAGRLTPWLACGEISCAGRRVPLGGLSAHGVRVAESPRRCTISLPGREGLQVHAHLNVPPGAAAGWRYADPDGGEHDVVNCSVASLTLNVHPAGGPATILHSHHGAAFELGMREQSHGVTLAPFTDG
jgi:hypothetical protein